MENQALASYQTPSGQTIKIEKQLFSSVQKKPTKRISFVSGLHGNELEGIYLCYLLIRYLKNLRKNHPEAFQGEVRIYPAISSQAIAAGSRLWPFFGTDINRQFGGSNGNSLPAQSAKKLIAELKASSDIVVDFHASNIHLEEAPQIRIIDGFHKKLLPLAVLCNADLIWVHPASPMFESTLGYNLNQSKIPTLIIETGIALRINQDFTNLLFQGMLNLLYHTGVITPTTPKQEVNYPIIVRPSQVVLIQSKHAGLFVGRTKIKNNVSKGDIIGEIVGASNGEILQDVIAPDSGFLFTMRKFPLVYPGAPLARIAQKNIS